MAFKINFLLPGSGHAPIGGYRVAYEYANGLAARGHHVRTIHPAMLYRDTPAREIAKKLIRYFQRKASGSYRPDGWFQMDPRVKMEWVPSLHPRYIPVSDIVVATAWQTAEWLDLYPEACGAKAGLVYDFEHFMSAEAPVQKRIARAFSQPLKAIATSPAVSNMLRGFGVKEAAYVPNGINFVTFHKELTFDDARRNSVGFPTRIEMFKGTHDAIRALSLVREHYSPSLRIWSFGGRRPSFLPDWVDYHERPSDDQLRRLYNESLIFAVPSHYEGWGLPGAEAMACGAALASTDNGGVRVYAKHLENALLSAPRDPLALSRSVLELLNNRSLRLKLAQQGHSDIGRFTWNAAVDSLERVLQKLVIREKLSSCDEVHVAAAQL